MKKRSPYEKKRSPIKVGGIVYLEGTVFNKHIFPKILTSNTFEYILSILFNVATYE
jgi:hypothetical protein